MNSTRHIPDLSTWLAWLRGGRTLMLTGAGCSTESGIPDYRGPETARRARRPVQFREFVHDPEARRRYWARSVIGWPKVDAAEPNPAHHALAQAEAHGWCSGVITQNVDRLHHRAGSREVVELHGALEEVICMRCGDISPRHQLQQRLLELNPGWTRGDAEMAPDGDAELEGDAIHSFRVAPCLACGGPLKPHVVFFGENVPRPRVDRAYAMLEEADRLVVVGSSLVVFSGYRFVKRAAKLGKPVGLLNLGTTRGDKHAELRWEGYAGEVLPALHAGIAGERARSSR